MQFKIIGFRDYYLPMTMNILMYYHSSRVEVIAILLHLCMFYVKCCTLLHQVAVVTEQEQRSHEKVIIKNVYMRQNKCVMDVMVTLHLSQIIINLMHYSAIIGCPNQKHILVA